MPRDLAREHNISTETPDPDNPCDSLNWQSRIDPDRMRVNPVHPHPDGAWYWYDETWANEFGPYDTEQAAGKACKQYCQEVLG